MQSFRLAAIPTIAITSLLLILASGYSGFAQTPAPPPTLAPPLISLAEARAIIDGAVAFTRDQNLNMAVVVVDAAGNLFVTQLTGFAGREQKKCEARGCVVRSL